MHFILLYSTVDVRHYVAMQGSIKILDTYCQYTHLTST